MKNTITSILICFLLFTAPQFLSPVSGQNIEKAFELIKEKDYDKAINIFRRAISKGKYDIAARYGMAVILCDEKYHFYNTTNAYKYIKYVERNYVITNDRRIKKLDQEFQIDGNTIQDLKNQIVQKAMQDAKEINTVEKFDEFIKIFENEWSYKKEAVAIRDKLAYQKAQDIDNYQSYESFVEKYPKSEYYPEAKKIYEQKRKGLYKHYTHDGEYKTFLEFEDMYPYFNVPDTTKHKDKRLAYRTLDLHFDTGVFMDNEDHWDLYFKVEKYDKYIRQAAPKELAFVAIQRLIEQKVDSAKWNEALEIVNKYKPYFPDNDTRMQNLIKTINQPPDSVQRYSISSNINSDGNEYAPIITGDNNKIYFCGKRREGNLGFEDIFVAEKNDEGIWQSPRRIKGLNTKTGNEAPLAVSSDGTIILLYADGDIYYSYKTTDGWAKKTIFPDINTVDWEADAMLTSEGNTVLFVSDRKGNIGHYRPVNSYYHGGYNGNTDIYVSHKIPDGWSKPVNLGKNINTPYCDRSPFLHPDMKTLYFSSEGHGGLGRMDVFMSKRLNDSSWTEWSEPVNIGKSINTIGDDWGFRITIDGEYAYFSAKNENDMDIFLMDLPQRLKPQPVATIKGKLVDSDKKAIEAVLLWEDLTTGKQVGIANADPVDGSYFIVLPTGKLYGIFVNKDGYYPVSRSLDLRNVNKNAKITENFEMVAIKEIIYDSIAVPLNNLFFDHNRYTIKPTSYPELNRFAKFIMNRDSLIRADSLLIEISGHTDNTGTPAHNKILSQNRAKAVYNYLADKGCNTNYMISIGQGQQKPVATNKTEKGKALNRRVEFRILRR